MKLSRKPIIFLKVLSFFFLRFKCLQASTLYQQEVDDRSLGIRRKDYNGHKQTLGGNRWAHYFNSGNDLININILSIKWHHWSMYSLLYANYTSESSFLNKCWCIAPILSSLLKGQGFLLRVKNFKFHKDYICVAKIEKCYSTARIFFLPYFSFLEMPHTHITALLPSVIWWLASELLSNHLWRPSGLDYKINNRQQGAK